MLTIDQGDAFAILPTLEPNSFDAIITDPPYSSGGKSLARLQGKQHANKYFRADTAKEFDDGTRDQLSHHLWTCDWLRLCLPLLKPGGWLIIFTDWRQLALTHQAVQCAGFNLYGLGTWHKPNSLPQLGRFSKGDEYMIFATKGMPAGGAKLAGTGAKTYAQTWCGLLTPRDRFHATSKPLALMRHLMQPLPPAANILDPFAGGGSTLIAAAQLGHSCHGIELTEANYQTTLDRTRSPIPPILPPQITQPLHPPCKALAPPLQQLRKKWPPYHQGWPSLSHLSCTLSHLPPRVTITFMTH